MQTLTAVLWTAWTYLCNYWEKILELFGGFFLLIVLTGYVFYRVERNINRKLTQPFRDAMEDKQIRIRRVE
jgi:hypothetical protein